MAVLGVVVLVVLSLILKSGKTEPQDRGAQPRDRKGRFLQEFDE